MALVRPKLEYGSVIWDPYTKQDISKLENVQRSAARFIMKDYHSRHEGCVTEMLKHLKLPSLQDRRRDSRLTGMYRQSTRITTYNHRGKGGLYGLLDTQILITKTLWKTTLLTTPSASNQFPPKLTTLETHSLSDQFTTGTNWMIVL